MIASADLWRLLKANPALVCAAALAATATLIYVLPWIWILHTQLIHEIRVIDLAQRDFVNYWMAARMTLSGTEMGLFTHDIYFAHLQELFGKNIEIRSWSYPPHFLLMLWPLGYLDYELALAVFLAGSLALFVASIVIFRAKMAPQSNGAIVACAVFGFAVMQLDATQNGFLTAAFLLLGLAWMKERPLLAGLTFACLTIKPQLGFLIPVLLLWDRNWPAFLWSAAFALALVGASAALFGIESWGSYLTQTLAYQRTVMTDWYGVFLLMMPTAFGSARALGATPATAMLVQWPVSIAGAALVAWLLSRERDPLHRCFIAVCGTFVITPYAFNYDMGALSAIAAMVASAPVMVGRRAAATVIAGIAAMSAIVLNLGRAGLPIAPLLLMLGLLLLAPREHRTALAGFWRFALERDVFSGKEVRREGDGRAEDQREQRHAPQ